MSEYKDPENMDADEFEEFLEDVKSGYAFDPDNEVLEKDKNTTINEFFKSIQEDLDKLSFSSLNDLTRFMSRVNRIFSWMQPKIKEIDVKLEKEFKRRLSECG